jgi:hypothetical protein
MTEIPAPEHFGGEEEAETLETDAFLLAERALADVVERSAMAALYGVAGTGKTYALRTLVRDLEAVRPIWVEFEARPTLLHVARVLSRALGEDDPSGNRNQLSLSILSALRRDAAKDSVLLVVDEAQRLNTECMEYLRYLHDHVSTGFAMVLAGGNGCWAVISGEPMLESRIFRRVEFELLDEFWVVKNMPRYHPVYRSCSAEVIGLIDDEYAGGNFRRWANFTVTAARYMREHKKKVLTEKLARLIIRLLGGGEEMGLAA